MLSQDYLSLRLIRLKNSEHWAHDGAELAFVFPKGGSGIFAPSPTESRLIPGDVLVLNGGFRGRISAAGPAEMAFWFFAVNIEHLFPLFGCKEVCLLQGVTESFRIPRLYPASSPIALESHKLLGEVPPRFDLDHRGQLLRVVAGILSAEFKNLRPHRDGFVGMDEHITQVFEKMSVSEILSLSVGQLAAKFNCSRRHLNRLFHQHFGLSVAALRMEMRLLKAVSLLRDPAAKVINVAEQCGFNHLGLFNACFKRRFGTSPGQWRKTPGTPEPPSPGLMEGDPACRLHANGLCPWAGKQASRGLPLQSQQPRNPRSSEPLESPIPGESNTRAPGGKKTDATVFSPKLRLRPNL